MPSVFGLGVLLLLRPPRLWDTLRERPELLDATIEEILRYATVLQFGLLRVAREPLTLADQAIRPGDRVVLHLPTGTPAGSPTPTPSTRTTPTPPTT